MARSWCIWCEPPESWWASKEKRMFWIHEKCFEEFNDAISDLKSMKKRLDERESTEEISRFIKRMEVFKSKWDNTTEALKSKGFL